MPKKRQIRTFGAIVRSQRTLLGFSQLALAEKLGVTQPTVARWEADQSFPKPPELSPLAAALQIPLEELLKPLEELAKQAPPKTTRDQISEINTRLDRLEQAIGRLLGEISTHGN